MQLHQRRWPARPRRYSEQEKSEKLRLIETHSPRNSNPQRRYQERRQYRSKTYYHWKGAAKGRQANDTKGLRAPGPCRPAILADLVQLEEGNQRLRKLLAEKLRAENAELRKNLSWIDLKLQALVLQRPSVLRYAGNNLVDRPGIAANGPL